MSNSKGFIKVDRSILEWEWYGEVNVFKLFMHLILRCNWEDKKWKGISIKRGQLITGRKQLAIETGLSEQKIRTSLKKLLSTKELIKERVNNYTLITLVNYEKYQNYGSDKYKKNVIYSNSDQSQLKKDKDRNKENFHYFKEEISNNKGLMDQMSSHYTPNTIKKKINEFANWCAMVEIYHDTNTDLYNHFENWMRKPRTNY